MALSSDVFFALTVFRKNNYKGYLRSRNAARLPYAILSMKAWL